MKKYRVNVNGTSYEVEIEEMTGAPAAAPVSAPAAAAVTPEMVAAVAAAIAEDMGTDVSAIRIVSMKKI